MDYTSGQATHPRLVGQYKLDLMDLKRVMERDRDRDTVGLREREKGTERGKEGQREKQRGREQGKERGREGLKEGGKWREIEYTKLGEEASGGGRDMNSIKI